jgi:hypothetical protein
LDSLQELERAALAGASDSTRLEVVRTFGSQESHSLAAPASCFDYDSVSKPERGEHRVVEVDPQSLGSGETP